MGARTNGIGTDSPSTVVAGSTVPTLRSTRGRNRVRAYAVRLVNATRNPAAEGLEHLQPYLDLGGSPRASLALIRGGAKRLAQPFDLGATESPYARLGRELPEVEPVPRGVHEAELAELWEEMTMVRRSAPPGSQW